jgi:hypothetical protein
MAEYICDSSEDICKVCAFFERCNENFKEGDEPDRENCVNGILNYFEGLKYKDERAD